jgi:hypothetical protein
MRVYWSVSLAFLAACADIVGIESLGVEPPTATTTRDGGDASDSSNVDVQSPVDAVADTTVTPPTDGPAPKKHIFVTTDTPLGNFGGLAGGDTICNAAAKRATLDGTWVAWLSATVSGTDVNAIDRIPHNGPFYDLNDIKIALDKNQLKLGLTVAITVTEQKGTASNDVLHVWTGTNPNGAKAGGPANGNCFDWTSAGAAWPGIAGLLTSTTSWSEIDPPNDCAQKARLYCFEL